MPFRPNVFIDQIPDDVTAAVRAELGHGCDAYLQAKTPIQKARIVHNLMSILDSEVTEETRHEIMEACGGCCIGASTLKKAKELQRQASSLDELLKLLNENHIGGGYLESRGRGPTGAGD